MEGFKCALLYGDGAARELSVWSLNVGGVTSDQSRVRWVIKHHTGRHGRHRVRQNSELLFAVCVAAVMSKLANASLLKIETDLRSVVAQKCPNVVLAREVLWQRVINPS